MRVELVNWLRGRKQRPLELVAYEQAGPHVMEGVLVEDEDYWYPITAGVPCLLRGGMRSDSRDFMEKHGLAAVELGNANEEVHSQVATTTSFSDKWSRFRKYGFEPGHGEFLFDWYCKKLGVEDRQALEAFYAGKEAILEVGPGSGFNSRFMAEHTPGTVIALDISDAAYTAFENTKDLHNCHAVQADLMDAPFDDGEFDFVIADGVLHHTPNTRKAVEALYRKVQPGGQFFFYVYRQMGAIRRYCDEYVRSDFTQLTPEECYAACEGFTELGRELTRIGARINLEKGIPILGIPPGSHDVQRLFYYNFVKCFWNDAFDFETNNMVNFDWYHPHDAWQHTEEEVAGWLNDLGVDQYQFNRANPNGISVLLTKP